MLTLIKLAWRNIWRNRRRTIILICAMSTGLIGILITIGFMNAWLDSMIQNSLNKESGHIGIFAKGYFENPAVEKNFIVTRKFKQKLSSEPMIEQWTQRININGLVNNAEHSSMVKIMGVDPKREGRVTVIPSKITEGRWLTPDDTNAIIIGKKTAEKFKTKLGRKMILLTQQLGGEVGTAAYRIKGIFESGNESFDESVVYINLTEAKNLVALGDKITEVIVVLADLNQVDATTLSLRNMVDSGTLEVLSWKEQQPLTWKMVQWSDQMMWIWYAIFFIAMAFGIVNTLLMAVNERYREIGIMLAIGTKRWQVVTMIVWESFFLALCSLIVGNLAGIGLVHYFGSAGLDLSGFAAGMEMYGTDRILYPSIGFDSIMTMSTWTFIISLIFSLYPAIRASRFKPIEAIQRL